MHCTQLKIWLLQNGISQKQISDDTGLHQNTISKIVRTGEATKSVRVLLRLYFKFKTQEEFEELLKINGEEKEQ